MRPEANPLVSVIIPTYNRAYCLERAVNSLLNQTYKEFEIIISDDGSTDNTASLVSSLNDPKINYIYSQERQGANAARNRGIRAAKGEYIAFQDSDDEWLPEKLQVQMDAIHGAGANGKCCFCMYKRVIGQKSICIPKRRRRIQSGLHDFHAELLKGNFIGTVTLIVEKKALYEVGLFDEGLERLQDWDLALKLSLKNKFLYIDQPMVVAFVNEDSITRKRGLWATIEKIIEKYDKNFTANRYALFIQYIHILKSSIQDKESRIMIKYLLKILIIIPLIPLHLWR